MVGPLFATTTGTTPANIIIDSPGAQQFYTYKIEVRAQLSTGATGAFWSATVGVNRNSSGTVSIAGELNPDDYELTDSDASNWRIAASIISGSLVLTVTGDTAQTVNWTVSYYTA